MLRVAAARSSTAKSSSRSSLEKTVQRSFLNNQKNPTCFCENNFQKPFTSLSPSSSILSSNLSLSPPTSIILRSFSSNNNSNNNQNKKTPENEDPSTSQEIVLTPGQKVVAGSRLIFWSGVFAFACTCAYFIGKELLPSKMSPNSVFNQASSLVKDNSEVRRRFGEKMKTYGRDHGGHREGRRNFVEHTEYTDKEDGSKRVRVRFNLEGPFGTAFVFAEVSSAMSSGEFVYVLVQDKRNGKVITVVDNRSAIMAARMAGGSEEGMKAFSNLLGGAKKD